MCINVINSFQIAGQHDFTIAWPLYRPTTIGPRTVSVWRRIRYIITDDDPLVYEKTQTVLARVGGLWGVSCWIGPSRRVVVSARGNGSNVCVCLFIGEYPPMNALNVM